MTCFITKGCWLCSSGTKQTIVWNNNNLQLSQQTVCYSLITKMHWNKIGTSAHAEVRFLSRLLIPLGMFDIWECQSVWHLRQRCGNSLYSLHMNSALRISTLMKKSGAWPVFWTTHDSPGEQPALHLWPSSSCFRLSEVASYPSTTVSAQSTLLISGYKSNLSYLKLMVACETGAPGRTAQ